MTEGRKEPELGDRDSGEASKYAQWRGEWRRAAGCLSQALSPENRPFTFAI